MNQVNLVHLLVRWLQFYPEDLGNHGILWIQGHQGSHVDHWDHWVQDHLLQTKILNEVYTIENTDPPSLQYHEVMRI